MSSAWAKTGCLYRKATWNGAGGRVCRVTWSLKRVTRVRWRVLAWLIVTQMWYPPTGSIGAKLNKGTESYTSTSVKEKPAPPTLAPSPDYSVPAYMSLQPFELLPQCWSSEQVSLSKFVCRPFKRKAWVSRSPPSHSTTNPPGFYSQMLWRLLFPALEP